MLLRATKHSKCSRAAWEFDEIPKQRFIQIYHIVLNIRDSEMEGVPTELLSRATLTTLFAITHNLCQLACVAWRFWLGELSDKGGRGQKNREEIGAGATWKTAYTDGGLFWVGPYASVRIVPIG